MRSHGALLVAGLGPGNAAIRASCTAVDGAVGGPVHALVAPAAFRAHLFKRLQVGAQATECCEEGCEDEQGRHFHCTAYCCLVLATLGLTSGQGIGLI